MLKVEERRLLYVNKRRKSNIFFYLLTLILLLVTISILLISKEPYFVYLVINIVLTIAFGLVLSYYLLNTLKDYNKKISYLDKVMNGSITKEYLVFSNKITEVEIEGMKFKKYYFLTLDNKERNMYVIDNISMDSNTTYYVESKMDHIISFEVHYE